MRVAVLPRVLLGLWLILASATAGAVQATSSEKELSQRWFARFFGATPAPDSPWMKFIREDVPDQSFTRGLSWRGTPLRIGAKTYAHGIELNATKHLLVHVGRPARRFVAEVGLIDNDDTRRGAKSGLGSVTFAVVVAGRPAFRSPTMRLADGALAVDVPLEGATELELQVGDAGDGRGYDQATWANASIELQDGTVLRLQDLPLESAVPDPFGFSFQYGGKPSRALLAKWQRTVVDRPTPSPGRRVEREVAYRDPGTGLEVRASATLFTDFPAVEWVVRLKNTGATDTPVLEAIRALDTTWLSAGAPPPKLHWAKGAVASFDDFAPQEMNLPPGSNLLLRPGGGRSSSQVMPFFNLLGAEGGVLAAIGWTGEWAASFQGGPGSSVKLTAGQAHTHLVLHPGEEIRTPRIALLFFEGDRWRGQNLWRRFVLAHHRPTAQGRPIVAPVAAGNWGGTPAAIHAANIRDIAERDLPIEYYWIDAEWYGGPGRWEQHVGDWTPRAPLYPRGFRPLSDDLAKSGRKLLLWFEPERVFRGTPWARKHPEWLLSIPGTDNFLMDLGNPMARAFVTDSISAKIRDFGLAGYRQDFNIDPLPYWQKADAPNRQGIAENRYVAGLYAFWDELRQRHPSLIIDNCASGGRRFDLETLGRSVSFWRTDGPRDPIAHQCHTMGILPWVPLNATSADHAGSDYDFRSSMSSALAINWWVAGENPSERIPADFPFGWAKRTLEQYLELRRFYYGDFYPLTRYSQAPDVWFAYQLDLPETGEGLVVVLRRAESPYETASFKLQGLEAGAPYEIFDRGGRRTVPGAMLEREGLKITLGAAPGSALVNYRRKANGTR